ncbi:MAG: hypothetical protein KDA21_06765 [Phycisphaerales bacterium]|nr:hypothetical protein [Phycisphaerales bacterium]
MSTFAGLQMFDSGPHHFVVRRFGRAFARPRQQMNLGNFTEDYAMRELEIEQRGRLVADKAETLAALVEVIRYHAERSTTGVLIDHDGVPWPDMTLMEVALEERVCRGRLFSVAYRVTYLRMGGG